MFDWDDARHFLAVHRTGSLTAAARQLGVNQSTVGRRLVSLEERLRVRLFHRSREGFRIAPAGEKLLAHAERMEDEAIAIAREIAGQETRLTGSVRLTAPDMFGVRIVAPLLAAFHARYPEIDLELDTDNRVRNLTKREADMAVRIGETTETGVVVRRLTEFRSAIYASEKYLKARGTPRGGDFSGHDFIGFSEPLECIADARWIQSHTAAARIVLRAKATSVQVQATLDGVGLAALPCYVAEPEPTLVRIVPPAHTSRQVICLAMHEDLRFTARIRVCADFLAAGIRTQAARFRGTTPTREEGLDTASTATAGGGKPR
jgi:DNA-binding transcriptional LysR family regulator